MERLESRLRCKKGGLVVSRLRIVKVARRCLAAVVGILMVAAPPALAQSPAPTASAPGSGPVAAASLVPTNSWFFLYFLLVPFGFSLLVIATVLFYIYRIQRRYYSLAQSLGQMGQGVRATPIHAFAEQPVMRYMAVVEDMLNQPAPAPPERLEIDGPGFVAVGVPADFTVRRANGELANNAQWSVTPDDAASLSVNTGSKVTVVPLKIGSFKLSASITAPNGGGSVLVTAIAPQATTEELPFIGQGYGSLVIAVLVVFAVIVLALTGILAGDAVATLFGGLLGYIFGVTIAAGGQSATGRSGGRKGGGS
jgi:hypothetical protein